MGQNKEYTVAFKLAGRLASSFGSSFEKATSRVEKLKEQLGVLKINPDKLEGLIALRDRLKSAETAMTSAKAKLERLKSEMAQSNGENKELAREFKLTQLEVNRTSKAFERQKNALTDLEAKMGTASTSTKALAKAQKMAQMRQNASQGVKSAAGGLMKLGAVVGGALAYPVSQAIAMEDAMAEVKKVADFDTPDGLENFKKQLQAMSLQIPMTAQDLAQIAAAAAQSGIATKDLAEFTEKAAQMGVAFDTTAEKAGTMMAKWKSGMNLTNEETYALADTVNYLSNNNAALASEIGDTVMRIGAMGKMAGLNEKQVAALAATTIGAGATAEIAATGIQSMLKSMAKGGSMSDKAMAAFRYSGVDPMQLQKDMQKDAVGAITRVLEGIQKNVPKDHWTQYLSEMFGDEAGKAIQPMMQNLDLVKKNFKSVANPSAFAGSMLKEFEARADTTSNSLILAKNALSYFSEAIGNSLLAPIKEASKAFVAYGEKIGKFINEHKEATATVLKWGGVVVGAVAAILTMKLAVNGVILAYTSLWSAVTKGAMVLKFLAANPVLLAIGALAALAYGAYQLYTHFDEVKAKAQELWEKFQTAFPVMSAIVKEVFNEIVGAFNFLKSVFGGLIDFVANVFTGQWGKAFQNILSIASTVAFKMREVMFAPIRFILAGINLLIKKINEMGSVEIFGKKIGVSIPEIPENLLGIGTATQEPVKKSISYGFGDVDAMSMKPEGAGANSNVTINSSPSITVNGAVTKSDAYEGVRAALAENQKSFDKQLQEYEARRRRVSFE